MKARRIIEYQHRIKVTRGAVESSGATESTQSHGGISFLPFLPTFLKRWKPAAVGEHETNNGESEGWNFNRNEERNGFPGWR